MADETKEVEDYKLKYMGEEVDKLLDAAKELKHLDDLMSRVQAGCASVSTNSAGTVQTKAINFSRAFGKIPNIVLIPITKDDKTAIVEVINSSTSGFSFKLIPNDENAVTDVYWWASE